VIEISCWIPPSKNSSRRRLPRTDSTAQVPVLPGGAVAIDAILAGGAEIPGFRPSGVERRSIAGFEAEVSKLPLTSRFWAYAPAPVRQRAATSVPLKMFIHRLFICILSSVVADSASHVWVEKRFLYNIFYITKALYSQGEKPKNFKTGEKAPKRPENKKPSSPKAGGFLQIQMTDELGLVDAATNHRNHHAEAESQHPIGAGLGNGGQREGQIIPP